MAPLNFVKPEPELFIAVHKTETRSNCFQI